uniref:Pyrin domain-containing protein n=1 Tax=Astyanax mexicanus TaxID=7994 RepID=A0A8B9I0I0_ASTMX
MASFRVQEVLLRTLEDLNAEELKRFQWHLIQGVLDGKPPMAKGKVEGRSLDETVSQVIQFYDDDTAADVTEKALQRMGQTQLARKLKKNLDNGKSFTLCSVNPAHTFKPRPHLYHMTFRSDRPSVPQEPPTGTLPVTFSPTPEPLLSS